MATIPIRFGPWLPDMPSLDLNGLKTAWNVVPSQGCYTPLASALPYNSSALPTRPLGAVSGLDRRGNAVVFAGEKAGLHKLDPQTNAWANVSARQYNTATGERWRFAEYGDLLLATNYSDPVQAFDKSASTQFTDLSTLVKARHITVLDNFVVVGNLFDGLDGDVPYRVRWSAIGDPGSWQYDAATMSDFQDISGYGAVTGLVGGEDGIILMQKAIMRMTFIGEPAVFAFKPIVEGKGCAIPESVMTIEGRTFFIDDDGFYMFHAGQLTNIGAGKVNEYFLRNADASGYNRMTVEADPTRKIVFWMYASLNEGSGQPQRFIIFNYESGNWSEGDASPLAMVFRSLSPPTTLHQLDKFGSADAVPASFDSPLWAGGRPLLAALDETGRIYTMEGPPRPATISTGEVAIADAIRAVSGPDAPPATRALTKSTRPHVYAHDGASIGTRIGFRDRLSTAQQTTALSPLTSHGETYHRTDGRYQQVTLTMSGNWTQAIGLDWSATLTGQR